MQNLAAVFAISAAKYPEQGFYSKDTHKFFKKTPFATLYRQASQLAMHLIQGGLKPGDRVAVFGDNSAEWLIADMAIQMAGAIVVPRGATGGTTSSPSSRRLRSARSKRKRTTTLSAW